MRRLLASLALGAAIALGGCETIGLATAPVDKASLEDKAYRAKVAFQATLVVAVAYIETPRCDFPKSPPICSEQSVVDVMRKGITMADAATQAAENAVRSLSAKPTVMAAAVAGAEEAVKAFKVIAETKKRGEK